MGGSACCARSRRFLLAGSGLGCLSAVLGEYSVQWRFSVSNALVAEGEEAIETTVVVSPLPVAGSTVKCRGLCGVPG